MGKRIRLTSNAGIPPQLPGYVQDEIWKAIEDCSDINEAGKIIYGIVRKYEQEKAAYERELLRKVDDRLTI